MARSPKHNESHTLVVGWCNWTCLDFGDIEKELAAKLSDDDIKEILLSINAAERLIRLRLTNCTNITGAGLAPLRGSSKLGQIDLSLTAKHQSPILHPEPALSREHVLPILDAIIQNGGAKLRYLQLPHAWRENRSTDSEFHAAIVRYKEFANSRGDFCCHKCSIHIRYDDYDDVRCDDEYAAEVNTCYDCLKSYCYRHEGVSKCRACEKCFCKSCSKVGFYYCCENWSLLRACKAVHHCEDCGPFCDDCKITCENCNRISCRNHFEFGEEACMGYNCGVCRRTLCVDCVPMRECDYFECEKKTCAECADAEKGGVDVVHSCIDYCDATLCNSHRLYECQQGHIECEECVRFLYESFKGNVQLLEKVKYRKRHAGLEVEEGYCPCGWCSSRPQLRFGVGQLVLCRKDQADTDRAHGKVIRLWHQFADWVEEDKWAPYLVELDDGTKGSIGEDIDSEILAVPELRFKVGQRVICRVAGPEGICWAHGWVIRIWYRDASWPEENSIDDWAPYQIELDDDEGTKVFAPFDNRSSH
eukprot:scaffold10223_cov96-Skeletonema_dohrnii-CCMP3373.AAC.12